MLPTSGFKQISSVSAWHQRSVSILAGATENDHEIKLARLGTSCRQLICHFKKALACSLEIRLNQRGLNKVPSTCLFST